MRGRGLNKGLENGQRIALRVATGVEEKEFSGVVQSFDPVRGRISLEMDDPMGGKKSFFPGQEATIIGTAPGADLDFPCVVVEESRFPILVCREVDRRNHLRVNAFLHLKYRPVNRELFEADPEGFLLMVREEMGNGESSFEELADELDSETLSPRLLSLLEEMSKKLDRILSLLEEKEDGQSRGAIAVNISGSGLRFTAPEKMEARKLLAIRIPLPLSPPVSVVFVGEVKRVREKGKGEFETAVKFVAIDAADQEKIVHYTFKRMREAIRNRKQKTGPT